MLALYLTADLQGVTNLRPDDTQDNPFWYMFKVQCTSCRETHANYVGINRFDTNEMSGSRGEANFVWKCKNCKRESSASIKMAPAPYEQTEPAKPQKIIEFDCRGLEFTEFKAEGDWLAEGVDSGTKFTDIELVEGEWFEYDEKSNEEVSINDIKWEVRRSFHLLREVPLLNFEPHPNSNTNFLRDIDLPPASMTMALSELPGTMDYLTDAAHLLRTTAPETSAHLMGLLLQQQGVALSDVQRQHVCGGCGLIMIPGQEATLKFGTRKDVPKKAKGAQPTTNSTPKLTQEPRGPCKTFHCNNCQQDTKIQLPPPGPAVRRKAVMASRVKKPTAPIETAKPTANASSKKRAKNRKTGLQALLSGQKQQAANPLSLSHFMK
ncbi:hypothetical protein FZEAL_4140 [Fusarium zealandicum]|uniref:DUF866-domain-containing protein n=1 Tax=Fusarium zealandicum TaxID=1053134 RepID=A0A8H4UN48_9HYPO|nr:hypothetical protein FZEAL_4140 [Fusarium zealandicum]